MAKNEVKVSFVGDDKSLSSAAKKAGQELGSLDNTLKGKLVGSLDNAQGKFASLGKITDRTGISFGGLVGSSGLATAAIGGALVAGIGSAVSAASDLNETVSATNQIFAGAAPQLQLYAESASAIGLSKQAALEAVNTFGDLFTAIGMSATESAARSQEFTDLAADLASFKNTSPEEAIMALGAALRGESEPIRRYGVLLDDATLKQKAMDMGLVDSTTGTLPPAIRAQAAYQLILDKTTNAQGDVERTSDSLANQTRRMKAEFENASAELGNNLIPYLEKAASAANNLLTGQGLLGVEYDKQSGLLGVLTEGLGRLTGGYFQAQQANEDNAKSAEEAAAAAEKQAAADSLRTKKNEDWATAASDSRTLEEERADAIKVTKEELDAQTKSLATAVGFMRAMAAETERTTSAADELGAAFDRLIGGSLSLDQATDNAIASQEAVLQAFKDNGATLDENTEKGRANRAQIRDSIAAELDYIDTFVKGGGTVADATLKVEQYRQNLIKQMVQSGLSQEAAEAYVAQLGLTPENVTTAIALANLEVAKAEAQAWINKLTGADPNGIPKETVTAIQALIDEGAIEEANRRLEALAITRTVYYNAVVNGGDFVAPGGGLPGFASGGMVPGPTGKPLLAVVHGGEEVRTPAQQRNGGGGGSTVINNVTIQMPPGADGEDVVKALTRWQRRNGPVPISTR